MLNWSKAIEEDRQTFPPSINAIYSMLTYKEVRPCKWLDAPWNSSVIG
jgi:hypothetical protein